MSDVTLSGRTVGYAALSARYRPMLTLVKNRVMRAEDVYRLREIDLDQPEREYSRSKQLIGILPDLASLRHDEATLKAALTTKAQPENAMMIFAAMIAANPTASRVTPDYAEALAELADEDEDHLSGVFGGTGFSEPVLFATAKRIVREDTFQPTVARFLDLAREFRKDVYQAWCVTSRLAQLRADAEAVIRIVEFNPADTDDEGIPF
jgi:hypothetical protein